MSVAASRLDRVLEDMALVVAGLERALAERRIGRGLAASTRWMAKPPSRETSASALSLYSTWLAGEQAPFIFGDLPVA